MTGGYDERCAADLANVCEGRDLSRQDRAWLARAVTGAMRPNRDKPLWDLAHALAALAQLAGARDGRDLVTLALDPDLAQAATIEARFSGARAGSAEADARGLVIEGAGWRITWSGLARLLALAEFVLTAEDLAGFATLSGWFDELAREPGAEAAGFLSKRLARHLAAYRNAHLPLAPLERRFRAILGFLHGRSDFGDDDVLEFWRAEMGENERPGFRTIAEHFVTFESVVSALGGLAGLRAAASLDSDEAWHDRVDTSLADVVGDEPAENLAAMLLGLPEGPKILTGAERDDLVDLLRLDPFHRTRPLTTLRAVSFGRVQSGIANRLRRGGGGGEVAERAACIDAEPYDAIAVRAASLAAHLKRMVGIAACLRLPAETADAALRAALQAAEADLKRVRRSGFDGDRAALAAGFAAVDETLVRTAEEVAALIRAMQNLEARRPLPEIFAADRRIFAETLTQAYAGESVS
jgi:BMFP domain-containing protein YqiC